MPRRSTIKTAQRAKRAGKKPTTQASAFVKEEIVLAKEGKRPIASKKQAIAIGLSKARRAGVKVPRKGTSGTRKSKSAAAKTRSRTSRTSRASRH
jgi:hypothetical protein